MTLTDEDLRNGTTTAAFLQHDVAFADILVDLDLADGSALALEQVAGALSIAAERRRIHDDFR